MDMTPAFCSCPGPFIQADFIVLLRIRLQRAHTRHLLLVSAAPGILIAAFISRYPLDDVSEALEFLGRLSFLDSQQ
jgi:hypothetical protein